MQQTLQSVYVQLLRKAFSDPGSNDHIQALAISLLSAQHLLSTAPDPQSRPLVLALVGLLLLETQRHHHLGSSDFRRTRLLGYVGGLILLSQHSDNQQRSSSDTLLASLRAERARFSRLLQAHMRLALGNHSHCHHAVDSGNKGAISGRSGVPPTSDDPDSGFEDIMVPVSSINSVMFLLEHVERFTSITTQSDVSRQGSDPALIDPPLCVPEDMTMESLDKDNMKHKAHGLLYYLQGIIDVLAARAEELGVHLSTCLPAEPYLEHEFVAVAFPHVKSSEEAYTHGVWTLAEAAIQPARHVLLETCSILLEHYLQPGDEICFIPRYVSLKSTTGLAEKACKASAVIYLGCRRGLLSTQSNRLATREPPLAWSSLSLDTIQLLTSSLYPGRIQLESRWMLLDSKDKSQQYRYGGFDLAGMLVDTSTPIGLAKYRVVAPGSDWLFVRLCLPESLEYDTAAELENLFLKSMPTVEVNNSLVLDAPPDFVPNLFEFRSMLQGARIVLRSLRDNAAYRRYLSTAATTIAGACIGQDALETESESLKGLPEPIKEHIRLFHAIEGYLSTLTGCLVEHSTITAFPARTPGTPGMTGRHSVAQKPPAYVIIDNDMDILKSEFETLRGTLTFVSSSARSQRGSPFDQSSKTSAQNYGFPGFQPGTPQAGSTSGGGGGGGSPIAQSIRRKGVYTATLGIIVLVPISAMAAFRECVRVLSNMPHPLPPPVVKLVPKPITERRLLNSLRDAWETRRQDRRASVSGREQQPQTAHVGRHHLRLQMPGYNVPYHQCPESASAKVAYAFSPVGASIAGGISATYGSHGTQPRARANSSEPTHGHHSGSQQQQQQQQQHSSTLSTPHSVNSEGYYQNVHTVADSPSMPVNQITTIESGSSTHTRESTEKIQPPAVAIDTSNIVVGDSKDSDKDDSAKSPIISPDEFITNESARSKLSRNMSMSEKIAQLAMHPYQPHVSGARGKAAVRGKHHAKTVSVAEITSMDAEFGSGEPLSKLLDPDKDGEGGSTLSSRRMGKRPVSLGLVLSSESSSNNNFIDTPPAPPPEPERSTPATTANTPPSPLIEMDDPMFVKSLRKATPSAQPETTKSKNMASGLNIDFVLPASKDNDSNQPYSHPGTSPRGTISDGSTFDEHGIVKELAATVPATAPNTLNQAATMVMGGGSEDPAMDTVQSNSPVSAGGRFKTLPSTHTTSTPVAGSLPTSSNTQESGLTKTRMLLRDKMSMFNRAKQKAKNKLRAFGAEHVEESSGSSTHSVPRDGGTPATSSTSASNVNKPLPLPPSPTDSLSKEDHPSPGGDVLMPPNRDDVDDTQGSDGREPEGAAKDYPPLSAIPEKEKAKPDDSQPSKRQPKRGKGARDPKARLRARLQNASKKMAESKQWQEAQKGDAEDVDQLKGQKPNSRTSTFASVGSGNSAKTEDSESMISTTMMHANRNSTSKAVSQGKKDKKVSAAMSLSRSVSLVFTAPPIRVLVVEDNLINRSIMERFLRHMNISYDAASNGQEAVDMWAEAADDTRLEDDVGAASGRGPYHIVFMDIQMPIMDGIKATKHIRDLERQKKIGVWVSTGSVASMAMSRAAVSKQHCHPPAPPSHGGSSTSSANSRTMRTLRWTPFYAQESFVKEGDGNKARRAASTGLFSKNGRMAHTVPTRYGNERKKLVRSHRSLANLQNQMQTASKDGELAIDTRDHTPLKKGAEDPDSVPAETDTATFRKPRDGHEFVLSPNNLESDSVKQIAMFPEAVAAHKKQPTTDAVSNASDASSSNNSKRHKQRPKGVLQLPPRGESAASSKDHKTAATSTTTTTTTTASSSAQLRSPVIIVALTASSLESDRRAALAAGCNDFLTKPVSLEWLKSKIMEWGCMQALIDHDKWRKWRSTQLAQIS